MVEKETRAQRLKRKAGTFKKEFKNQLVIAILAAFGFLIALGWRDFISEFVNKIALSLNVTDQLYLYKLFSAITITIIAVLGILVISKFKSED